MKIDIDKSARYLTNEAAEEKALAMNLEVVVPDEYTLSVDIDSSWEISDTNNLVDKLGEHYPIEYRALTISKSGNLHLYVKMKTPFTMMEKIALQAILGSDPVKELLSFIRAKEGSLGEPTLMFENKQWAKGLTEFCFE